MAQGNQEDSLAARKTLTLSDAWREKIQTSMLINRLQDHIEGRIELSSTQVTAALGLLKKTAPDLAAITVGGDANNPLVIVSGAKESLGTKLGRMFDREAADIPANSIN